MTAPLPCSLRIGTDCRSYGAPSLHLFRYHQCPGDCAARVPPDPAGKPPQVVTITREYLQP